MFKHEKWPYNLLQRVQYSINRFDWGVFCMAKKNLAKTIREVRAAFGLTQEQFAAKIGVTYSTVNRWENDKGKPSPLAMLRIEELQNELGQNS